MTQLNIYNQNLENETLPQIFNFDGNKVRVVIDEKGDPWFCAADVADVLGYNKTNHVTRILEDDEKGAHIVGTLGGSQKLATVNESGLYSLIFLSRKDEARKFKKRVTNEVLPTIRKTGGYGQQLSIRDPKHLRQLLLESAERVIELEYQQRVDQPKVDFYDNFINVEGLYNLQNAGRAIGLNHNLFIDSLKDNYLFYQGNALVPYRQYVKQGLFVLKSNAVKTRAYYQTYVTPKGLEYFSKQRNYLEAS